MTAPDHYATDVIKVLALRGPSTQEPLLSSGTE